MVRAIIPFEGRTRQRTGLQNHLLSCLNYQINVNCSFLSSTIVMKSTNSRTPAASASSERMSSNFHLLILWSYNKQSQCPDKDILKDKNKYEVLLRWFSCNRSLTFELNLAILFWITLRADMVIESITAATYLDYRLFGHDNSHPADIRQEPV